MEQSETREPDEIIKILAQVIRNMECTVGSMYRLLRYGWGKPFSDDDMDAEYDVFFDSLWNAGEISGDEALNMFLENGCAIDREAFVARYGSFLTKIPALGVNIDSDELLFILLAAAYWSEAANAYKEQDIPVVWRCLIEATLWYGNATGRLAAGNSDGNTVAWLASLGAARKHAKHTEPDKALVRECWLNWQADPGLYKNKVSFDRDMLEKMQRIEDIRTVTKWRLELQKEHTPC